MVINKKVVFGLSALMISGVIMAGCGQQTSQQASNSATPIVMVDHQLVVENNPNMAKAQDIMKQEYDKIRNEVEDTQALSPEDRQKKMMEFQNRLQELEKKNLIPVQKESEKAVEDVMKEKGATMVVDKRAVVAGGLDITKEVLQKEGISADEAQKMIDKANNGEHQH